MLYSQTFYFSHHNTKIIFHVKFKQFAMIQSQLFVVFTTASVNLVHFLLEAILFYIEHVTGNEVFWDYS